MTAYKNEDFIFEALDSIVISAGKTEFEILVGIDNCKNTFNSLSKKYRLYKDNIKIYFFENKPGTYVIRNTLVLESKYNDIIFFDSDDVMCQNMIPDITHNLKSYDVIRPMFKMFKEKIPQDYEPTFQYSYGAFAIKKDVFLSLNGFEPWICAADGDFIWRCEMNNFKIKHLQKLSFFYRRHDGSLTTINDTNMKSMLRKKYHNIRNEKKINNDFGKLSNIHIDTYDKIDEPVNISIIIPTYNIINYLDECLSSVITSIKDLNCEILVGIDNCENTLNYVKEKTFDRRIRFFNFKKNVGPYIIKNTLSLLANSKTLLFFDSDDIMEEQLIQDVINYSKTHELIKPMYLDFNENVTNIDKSKTTSKTYGEGVFAIQLKLFQHMNGFEGWRCAADSDFMNRLYKNNVKLTHTKQIGFYRRIHPNSLTQHPETNMSSKLRGVYSKISKLKKNYEPLHNLVTEKFTEVVINELINSDIEKFQLVKDKIKTILNDVIKINVKPREEKKDIDYNLINNVLSDPKHYHPSKNIKLPKENIPTNRNELLDLKKGTLSKHNREFFPQKRNRDFDFIPISKPSKRNDNY